MRKGLVQAEEFGFHPEGGGSQGRFRLEGSWLVRWREVD